MKKKFLFAFLIFPVFLLAQESKIKEIRAHYTDVNSRIQNCQKTNSDECQIYCDEVNINSKNGSWRAVGIFNRTIKFWYDDDPSVQTMFDSKPENVLLKIEISEKISANEFFYEILFKDGKLIFYFFTQKINENNFDEFRYYFDNAKLIRYVEGSIEKTSSVDQNQVQEIRKTAKYYQEQFLNLH